MNASQIYIAISIVVLAIIVALLFFTSKHKAKRLTPLAGLAFGFILAGLIFGEERLIGYGLMGIGIILAAVDIFNSIKSQQLEDKP